MEKKIDLLKLQKRLLAGALVGVVGITSCACSRQEKSKDVTPLDTISSEGIAIEIKPTDETRKEDGKVAKSTYRKVLPVTSPIVYDYNIMLKSTKAHTYNIHDTNILCAVIGHEVHNNKLSISDDATYVLPNRFYEYDDLVVLPSKFKGYEKRDILNGAEKEEDVTLLKGNNDEYYVYTIVTYTFKKGINIIKPISNDLEYVPTKPMDGDQIVLTLLDKVISNKLGVIATEPMIRKQTGVGAECQNVLDNNMGSLDDIMPIESNYYYGIEGSVGLENPEDIKTLSRYPLKKN